LSEQWTMHKHFLSPGYLIAITGLKTNEKLQVKRPRQVQICWLM
jgi:hypothetical protein